MQKTESVFVTGATGNQGGAAVRHLLSKGFHIKALVRNPDAIPAQLIRQNNDEIIKGDLNDPASYRHHLQNLHAVFCNLQFTAGVNKEVQQGLNLVDNCKEQGVKHLIYSSVVGCDLNTGIPHWESKFKIEKHIESTGINFTILRPASLYENLLVPQVKSRVLKGKLVLPTAKNCIQQFVGADDVGRISAIILTNPEMYAGRTIGLAAEQMDGSQLATIFSEVLKREIKFQQLPMFITRLIMGKGLAKMFRWINDHDGILVKDIDSLKKEFPGMLSIEKWIDNNFRPVSKEV